MRLWDHLMDWFKDTFRSHSNDIKAAQNSQMLESTAIYRKHTGDLDGAIEAMGKAISLTMTVPILSETTATSLNYLADLYLLKDATAQAEEALRESIKLSRPRYPLLLAANLWILAGIQNRKGAYREALASAEESRRLSQQQGHAYGVAQAEERIRQIKTNLGFTSASLGDPTAARASDTDESKRDP